MRFRFQIEAFINAPKGSTLGDAGTTVVLPDGTEVGLEPVLFKHVGGGMYDQVEEDEVGCEIDLHARHVEDADA